MAGIGQFTTADHSAPWNAQSQYAMGRSVLQDCAKPIGTYGSNFTKRPLFGGGGSSGTTSGPTFSDIANLCNSGYSRSGSSQQNGDILGSLGGGFPIRSYPQPGDQGGDNISSLFNNVGYTSQSGPSRNYSEPSLFPSLNSVNRTGTSEMGGGRVIANNPGSSKQMTTGLVNNRNTGNLYSGSDSGQSNPSNPTSSSRGMTLDPSEFPPILTSVGRGGSGGSASSSMHPSSLSNNQTPMRNYVSVMSKGSPASEPSATQLSQPTTSNQSTAPEFSKQDFPALPGTSQSSPSITSATNSSSIAATQSTSLSFAHRSMMMNPVSATMSTVGSGSCGSLTSHRSFSQASALLLNPSMNMDAPYSASSSGQAGMASGTGIKLLPNHLVAIPKSMICDQFGMLGLLKLIRVGDYDATLNMLAPGLDLSSLHSNWQNPGELHNTFVSPCHESCIGRPQDMDYAVPPEYVIRHHVAHRLPDPPMDQLSEEILFWLFYNCCREEVQLVAAKELYQREWRYHKKEQIWLTRCMGANFTTDNNSEQGEYYYWDPIKAQKSTHQMNILYSDLDNAPATFRVSSANLSASVSNASAGSNGGVHHHHHSHHQQQQQQQMVAAAAYQLQQQQQQSYHQAISTGSAETLLPNSETGGGLPRQQQQQQSIYHHHLQSARAGAGNPTGVSSLLLAAAAAAAANRSVVPTGSSSSSGLVGGNSGGNTLNAPGGQLGSHAAAALANAVADSGLMDPTSLNGPVEEEGVSGGGNPSADGPQG